MGLSHKWMAFLVARAEFMHELHVEEKRSLDYIVGQVNVTGDQVINILLERDRWVIPVVKRNEQ